MVSNPVTLVRKSPLLFRFVGLSRSPTTRYGNSTVNQLQTSGFRSSSSCTYLPNPLSCSSLGNTAFKEFSRGELGFKQLGYGSFRISAVSDGGSGGTGGSGGSGDGNSGGSGSGGGRSNWSLLSWYLNLLEKYPVWTKAVTSAMLTFVGDLICQLAIDQVPSLDLKRIFLFTFLGLTLVGPTLHFW